MTVEARANQFIVLDDELFVNTTEGVAHHDFFMVVTAHEIACAEQINTGYFQLGRSQATGVMGDTELCQMIRRDLGLFKQRCNQTVCNPTVRSAFANRVNAGIGHGLHGVIDHDAAINVQLHFFSQFGVGANTDRHHDQIGGYFATVFEFNGFDATIFTRHQFFGLCAHAEFQTAFFEGFLQHLARYFVQLAFHQPRRNVNHMHIHPAQHQTIRGFQAQQTAANHDRVFIFFAGFNHGIGIGDVAVRNHAFQIFTRHGQDERVRTRA